MRIDLTNPKKSDIKYDIYKFPDGEIQIKFEELPRKSDYEVNCRITSADDLFILEQVADILNRNGIIWGLNIYYLMSMRMDRVMDFNRAYSLFIVIERIGNLKARYVTIFEPHSDKTRDLLERYYNYTNVIPRDMFDIINTDIINGLPVFPDEGSYDRYSMYLDDDSNVIFANKKRNIDTGKIESIEIENPGIINNKPLTIIDDLCDGGGTFLGLYEKLRQFTDKPIDIIVIHMVNEKGLFNLANTFNKVYFTNSYKDWKKELGDKFPSNCIQLSV
jgi:ribose-phosphate pyrophosphokinase